MRITAKSLGPKLLPAAALAPAVVAPVGIAADWKPEEENKTLASLLRELGDAK